MTETVPEPAPPADWRRTAAFGWPSGSVRALMALIVFGSLWALLVLRPDLVIPEYLKDLLFIILGHYFAVRGRSDATSGPPPLYLPRGSIRFLLVAGFVGAAVSLHGQGKLLAIGENPAVVTLLLVSGFLLGVLVRQVTAWLTNPNRPPPRFLEDVRAGVSLAAALFLAVLVWDQFLPSSPHWGLKGIDLGLGQIRLAHLASAVVGFYFGSRS